MKDKLTERNPESKLSTVSQPSSQDDDTQNEFAPGDVLAERTFIMRLDAASHFIASPSILALPSGRLLVLFERCACMTGVCVV